MSSLFLGVMSHEPILGMSFFKSGHSKLQLTKPWPVAAVWGTVAAGHKIPKSKQILLNHAASITYHRNGYDTLLKNYLLFLGDIYHWPLATARWLINEYRNLSAQMTLRSIINVPWSIIDQMGLHITVWPNWGLTKKKFRLFTWRRWRTISYFNLTVLAHFKC